ncbi:hypothetical protein CerSpe_023110 [Prunus speciosa]
MYHARRLRPNEGRSLVVAGRTSSSEHTKSCARGHWRPTEDSKLKELVAQYGPQNWNLIAEHLDGKGTCNSAYYNHHSRVETQQPITISSAKYNHSHSQNP